MPKYSRVRRILITKTQPQLSAFKNVMKTVDPVPIDMGMAWSSSLEMIFSRHGL